MDLALSPAAHPGILELVGLHYSRLHLRFVKFRAVSCRQNLNFPVSLFEITLLEARAWSLWSLVVVTGACRPPVPPIGRQDTP